MSGYGYLPPFSHISAKTRYTAPTAMTPVIQ